MENTKSYQYSRLEKKHLPELQFLILKSFNKKISLDHLEKKYDTSYLEIDNIATIAHDGQKPIAFYGALPQLFQSKEEQFLVAHACDSYTLPEYQKQGLHYNLALKSYEIMQNNDIKMVYGYHSENTYYSTKRLSWEEHIPMKRFHLFTGALPLSKVLNKLNLKSLLLKRASNVLKPFLVDSLENPLLKEGRLCNQYSKEFYKYKEGFNKHHCIVINDCFFYLKVGAIMEVGFMDFPDVQSLQEALTSLRLLGKRIGTPEILFQLDSTTKQYKGLSVCLDEEPSWLIGYLPFDKKIDIKQFRFNYADLDTF